jgi:hypothetical protein
VRVVRRLSSEPSSVTAAASAAVGHRRRRRVHHGHEHISPASPMSRGLTSHRNPPLPPPPPPPPPKPPPLQPPLPPPWAIADDAAFKSVASASLHPCGLGTGGAATPLPPPGIACAPPF